MLLASIHRVRLEGHLTREVLERELEKVAPAVPSQRAPTGSRRAGGLVLLDCTRMTDYDLEARHAFVAWLKGSLPAKVAILTDRELWHLVIRTMSLASGVPLMPFADERAAREWLLA